MKKFKVKEGVILKSKNSTSYMMYTILISLMFFVVFAIFKNGIYPVINGYGNLYTVFKPLIYIIIPSVTCLFTEYIYYLIIRKKKGIFNLIGEEFALIPGVFLGLIISINTPLWLLILGSIIASLSKVLMGGLGKNKFNPALVGALFITIIFSKFLGGYLNPMEVDTVSSATPLSNMVGSGYLATYDNLVKPYGTLLTFFFGNIPGAIGETSAFLCIVIGLYLIYKKIIKWRIPVSYIVTVTIISLIICITKGIGPWFILFNLLSGGLLFGAFFMATDPVTSPINHFYQIIGGILLGVITMIIRYLTPLPEGVLISILIFNLFTILFNYLASKYYKNNKFNYFVITLTIIILLISSFLVSKNIITRELDDSFKIVSKEKIGINTIYKVSGRGYAGNNSIKLKITFKNDNIDNIEVISSQETYMGIIEDDNYLDKLINNDLDSVDTISGCTYTSKYLKDIVKKTVKDYNEG